MSDRLLSLSQAARMVGVPRRVLQQQIQRGELRVFEGSIRMSELLKAYPQARPDHSGMLEKTRIIKEGALFKFERDRLPDAEQLAAEAHRLRLALGKSQAETESYKQLVTEMKDRLLELQERCDQKQAIMLGTLISWFLHQAKLREDAGTQA